MGLLLVCCVACMNDDNTNEQSPNPSSTSVSWRGVRGIFKTIHAAVMDFFDDQFLYLEDYFST